MPIDRRLFMQATAGALIAMSQATTNVTAPASTLPTPPPGSPGDFDFLTGEWRIHNRFRENGTWIEFAGEATVMPVMGGVGSVEDLRIPARNFFGMGLRLLDVERGIWSDHFVNKRSGVVTVPGQTGGFADGVGSFLSEDRDGDAIVWYRGTWDRITPTSCRWYQSSSRDLGTNWDDSWYMDWTRAG
jgi:hypothetical protein